MNNLYFFCNNNGKFSAAFELKTGNLFPLRLLLSSGGFYYAG